MKQTETILLVEDEQLVRSLVRHILEDSGYAILEAANGAEALQLLKSSSCPPALLLTDVVMPQMSGPQLWNELVKTSPDTKVIYMSGYPDQVSALHGVETEVPFLQKPFSPSTLARKVREVLESRAEQSLHSAMVETFILPTVTADLTATPAS